LESGLLGNGIRQIQIHFGRRRIWMSPAATAELQTVRVMPATFRFSVFTAGCRALKIPGIKDARG